MFSAFLAKFEMYFIVAAVALIAALGWGWHEHHAGYLAAQADAASALEKANAKTDALQARLDKSTEDNSREIAKRDRDHAAELAAALIGIKPVIVRIPADSRQVPAPGATTGATAPGARGSADLPVSTERDVGTALVMLAGECQRDRDALIGWQNYYAQQAEIGGW